jgi:uncharacterized membrane protein YkvA (DUF1232 family)
VLGYADDALIAALALGSVTATQGATAIERHWPGTPEGLRLFTLPGRNAATELESAAGCDLVVSQARLI